MARSNNCIECPIPSSGASTAPWPVSLSRSLSAGSRVTLAPGVWHEFQPTSEECIIGEVSTANDDLHDNFFLDPGVGRFARIEEDEPALVKLVSE